MKKTIFGLIYMAVIIGLATMVIAPEDWGSSFDIETGERIFTISHITQGDNVEFTIDVSYPEGYQGYVLNYSYLQTNDGWRRYDLTGDTVTGTPWIRNAASQTINFESALFTEGETYDIAAYSCRWYENDWRCGAETLQDPRRYWMGEPFTFTTVDPCELGMTNRTSGGTVTSQAEDWATIEGCLKGSPYSEKKGRAFDDLFSPGTKNVDWSKWLDFCGANGQSWIAYHYAPGESYEIARYSITSANDVKNRDPKDWNLEGSNDGENWVVLDTQTGFEFTDGDDADTTSRLETKFFDIDDENEASYSHYRLNITDIWKAAPYANSVQIAEIELFECW